MVLKIIEVERRDMLIIPIIGIFGFRSIKIPAVQKIDIFSVIVLRS